MRYFPELHALYIDAHNAAQERHATAVRAADVIGHAACYDAIGGARLAIQAARTVLPVIAFASGPAHGVQFADTAAAALDAADALLDDPGALVRPAALAAWRALAETVWDAADDLEDAGAGQAAGALLYAHRAVTGAVCAATAATRAWRGGAAGVAQAHANALADPYADDASPDIRAGLDAACATGDTLLDAGRAWQTDAIVMAVCGTGDRVVLDIADGLADGWQGTVAELLEAARALA